MSTPSPTVSDQQRAAEPRFEDTLNAVCEAAVRLVGVDHSGLVLFDPDRNAGTVRAEYPLSSKSALGQRVEVIGIPPEERLVQNRQPIVVNDVAKDASLGSVKDVLLNLGIKSILVVPIVVDGQVRGSFSFDSVQETRTFEDTDIQKCNSLAEFASIVVKNAYLVENL